MIHEDPHLLQFHGNIISPLASLTSFDVSHRLLYKKRICHLAVTIAESKKVFFFDGGL